MSCWFMCVLSKEERGVVMMNRLCAGGGYSGGSGYSYGGFSSPNPFGGYTASYQSGGYRPAQYNYNGGYGGGFRGGYHGGDQFMRSGACNTGYQNVRFGYNNGGYGGGGGYSYGGYGGGGRCGTGGFGFGGGGGFIPRPGWFQTQNGPVYVGFNTYFNSITNAINGLYGGNFSGGFGGLGGFGGGFGSIF